MKKVKKMRGQLKGSWRSGELAQWSMEVSSKATLAAFPEPTWGGSLPALTPASRDPEPLVSLGTCTHMHMIHTQ